MEWTSAGGEVFIEVSNGADIANLSQTIAHETCHIRFNEDEKFRSTFRIVSSRLSVKDQTHFSELVEEAYCTAWGIAGFRLKASKLRLARKFAREDGFYGGRPDIYKLGKLIYVRGLIKLAEKDLAKRLYGVWKEFRRFRSDSVRNPYFWH